MTPATATIYRAFGLLWQSSVPLPEARQAAGAVAPDVVLTLGDAARPDGLVTVVDGVAAGPGAFWMEVPDVAAYLATGGTRIVVAPCAGGAPASIRAYLLGSVIGALLLQRRVLPLHASVVAVHGRAVAFLGTSGTGKSTLAAALALRGHPLLADDIAAVTNADGRACVWPGLRTVKLCTDAIARQGRSTEGLQPVLAGTGKFQVPIGGDGDGGSRQLDLICLLRRGDNQGGGGQGGGGPVPLTGGQALGALIANTFRGQLVPPMALSAAHFTQCAGVARQVPAVMLARPEEGDAATPWVDAVEAFCRDTPSA